MILISDDHEHIIRDPKQIALVEVDDLGFIIKVDGVIFGFAKSHRAALMEMGDIAEAMKTNKNYQVCSSPE